MRYFDNQLVANSRPHAAWWGEVGMQREAFHLSEESLVANHGAQMAQALGLRNSAAVLPRDAWLEMDTITRRVMRDDEGEAYMADLMPLARPIHIGKIVAGYRVSGDAGTVRRSISGQVPDVLGKVDYDYRNTLVPIFNTSYGRSWREWNSLQSENFDALADDQEAHSAAIRENMADYALDGDVSLKFEGAVGYGIRNHPLSKAINLGSAAGGANIDLTTATADEIDAFLTGPFGAMLDANLITAPVNLYVSPEIGRSFDRKDVDSWIPTQGGGFASGTIGAAVERNRRINKVVVTRKLTGNAFFGFVPNAAFIRPLIGMAVNTTAMVRTNPVDDYNFLLMGAMGIDIRADINGKSGVFYSTDVD